VALLYGAFPPVSADIVWRRTFTVSKGCPTTREASPPTPPANKLAPGDALSLSRVDLWDNSGSVTRGGVVDLVQGDVVDLEVVGGDKVHLLSIAELVIEVTDGLVSACAMFAIATFISRIDGWIDREQCVCIWGDILVSLSLFVLQFAIKSSDWLHIPLCKKHSR